MPMPSEMEADVLRLRAALLRGDEGDAERLRRRVQAGLTRICTVLMNVRAHLLVLSLRRQDDYARLPRVLLQQADRIYCNTDTGDTRILKDRDGPTEVYSVPPRLPSQPEPPPVPTIYQRLLED